MVFAVEPKKGIKDIGMVGIENTFIVTPQGGECITGNNPGLIHSILIIFFYLFYYKLNNNPSFQQN